MPDFTALVRSRLKTSGLRPDREKDVVEDLAGQLEEAYREALARGLTPADAEAAAVAHITDWNVLATEVAHSRRLTPSTLDRVEGRGGFLGGVVHDIRYALRMARRTPMFTAVAVLTLALGIGANATIFSWIEAFLLDPLPGADSRGVVEVRMHEKNGSVSSMSYPDFMDLRATTPAAADLFVHDLAAASLSGGSTAERIWIEMVSDNFFAALRVPMAVGRGFQPREGREPIPVVVISEHLARERFGDPATAIDKALVINRTPFTIVGVTPQRFASGYTGLVMDAWLPIQMSSAILPGANRVTQRNNAWLDSLARVPADMSREQAAVQLTDAASRIAIDQRRIGGGIMILTPLWRSSGGAQSVMGPVLMVLMAMVLIVLLIACANIANLLLSRAAARSREFAMRLSLGCRRGRLIRQLLTEALVLVSFAAVAAVIIQAWTASLLIYLLPPNNMPVGLTMPAVSWRVLAFTAAVAFASAVIFGLAPAMQAGRTDLVTNLKADAGRLAGRRRSWLRNSLVVAQMAFAVLLVASALLFLRSLGNAQRLDVGFKAEGVLIGQVDLFSAGYDQARGTQLLTQILDDIRAQPGVESASLARRVPLGLATGSSSTTFEPEGYVAPKDEPATTYLAWVAPDYFKVMRIGLIAGREFTVSDSPKQQEVVLVNRAFVDRYWPGQNAIGRRLRFAEEWLTVAGVVENSKWRRLDERAAPFVFFSTTWRYRPDVVLHVRTHADPAQFAESLKAIVRRADPSLAVFNLMTLADNVKSASFQQQLAAAMLAVFGALALLLASIGVYASMAYSVSRRTREMGARLALGASPSDITRLVLGQAARLIAIGLAVGLVLAFGAAQAFGTLLVGIRPFDPMTFAGVSAILSMVAIVASYVPARRAARLDPLQALRQE